MTAWQHNIWQHNIWQYNIWQHNAWQHNAWQHKKMEKGGIEMNETAVKKNQDYVVTIEDMTVRGRGDR